MGPLTAVYFSIRNGRLVVVEKGRFDSPRVLEHHTGSIWAIAFDKDHLYTGSVDATVGVWDKRRLEVVRVLTGHRSNIQRLCLDDRYLISGSSDLSVIVWEKETGELVHRIRNAHRRAINGLARWRDRLLTSSFAERRVRI